MRFMLYALLFAVPSITIADENVTTVAVRKAIPDRLVVLTFDDSAKSHYTVVRPLLKEYQFGATFFITEGFDFKENKKAPIKNCKNVLYGSINLVRGCMKPCK